MKKLVQKYAITEIVHTTAITANSPGAEEHLAQDMTVVNFIGAINILDVAKNEKIRSVVYLSFSGLYPAGDLSIPMPEESPLRIKGFYRITKQASEHACRRYKELYGLDIVSTRIAAQYGPFERKTHSRQNMSMIHKLVEMAL